MNLLQTLLAFVVALGTLVIVHELGHYVVARICGVKVLRFSVGMGKIIYSRKFGPDQTEWAISVLPLGGYVKMLDAREQGMENIPEPDLPREFGRQSVWKRIAIVAAGPAANFLLAIFLYSALYMHGISEPVAKIRVPSTHSVAYQAGLRQGDLITSINDLPVQGWSEVRWNLMHASLEKTNARIEIQRRDQAQKDGFDRLFLELPLGRLSSKDLEGDFFAQLGFSLARPAATLGPVLPDGPAMQAGLKEGDLVLEIDDAPLIDGLEFTEIVNAAPGKPLKLRVQRGRNVFDVKATPVAEQDHGKTVGRLKIQMMLAPEMTIIKASAAAALQKGVQKTWDTSVMSLTMLGKMLTGEVSWKNVTGPLTIADYAGQTSRASAVSYLSFIALISISLGVMNLLPVPVLDGGHLLYYSLEVLTGKPVSERFSELAQRVGVILLVTLMAIAFFNDIVRLMS
ncbi:MAG: RIP metalloprotease RseP [Burkholderiales bacterium]|nr:RIP metalloprotease RseP [Burkholderiales bacterium]